MKSQDLKKFKLPSLSGVYLFKCKGEILYIGKATTLFDRVKSYFSKDLINTRGPLVVDMVFKSDKVDFIETQNALEALVLEAALIKKYQPYYNTKEKDNKSFNYVVITNEELPKVLIVRGRELEQQSQKIYSSILKNTRIDNVFGPFTNGQQLRDALKILRRIFPYLDKASTQKDKSAFYRQIGLSPDLSDSDAVKKYRKNIKRLTMFLNGSFGDLRASLEKEMLQLANAQKFEEAGVVKKKLFALDHIEDIALIKRENHTGVLQNTSMVGGPVRLEGYDIAHLFGTNIVGVMTVVVGGEIQKSEYRKFKIQLENTLARTGKQGGNDTESLKEVLRRRLNHPEWPMPNIIVADGGIAQKRALESVLKETGFNILVVSVVKDSRHKPRAILGNKTIIDKHKLSILLVNQESHRFAINFHRKLRSKLV